MFPLIFLFEASSRYMQVNIEYHSHGIPVEETRGGAQEYLNLM